MSLVKHFCKAPSLVNLVGEIDLENIYPFVFAEEIAPEHEKEYREGEDYNTIVAAPFTSFSIELEERRNGEATVLSEIIYNNRESEDRGYIYWIACEELSPNQYRLDVLQSIGASVEESKFELLTMFKGDKFYGAVLDLVTRFLSLMKKSDLSMSGAQSQITRRVRGKLKKFRPNNIVYVSKSRKNKLTTALNSPMKIRYLNSWSVMGHWRKISPTTMGKDRLGHRNTPGFTWISDFIKGDKSLGGRVAVRKVS